MTQPFRLHFELLSKPISFSEIIFSATAFVSIYDLFLKVHSKSVAASKVALNVKTTKMVSLVYKNSPSTRNHAKHTQTQLAPFSCKYELMLLSVKLLPKKVHMLIRVYN